MISFQERRRYHVHLFTITLSYPRMDYRLLSVTGAKSKILLLLLLWKQRFQSYIFYLAVVNGAPFTFTSTTSVPFRIGALFPLYKSEYIRRCLRSCPLAPLLTNKQKAGDKQLLTNLMPRVDHGKLYSENTKRNKWLGLRICTALGKQAWVWSTDLYGNHRRDIT
jgi:hypothetical protein